MDIKNRVNFQIKAQSVRVIGDDNTHEVLTVKEAVAKAQELGLDLIEINPNATPPICKITDVGKFKYQQEKHDKEQKKKQHTVKVKELKFHPNTGDHDIAFKLKHAREFIEGGDKVKLVVVYRGREISHKEVGTELMEKLIAQLADIAKVDSQPKMEEKQLIAVLYRKG